MLRWTRQLVLVAVLICPALSHAINLKGNGTITEKEQQALEYYIRYFGRAGLFVREYCIFDDDGNPKNTGTCHAEIPRLPVHSTFGIGGGEAEYARQFRGMAMGDVVANPKMNLVYVHAFPEVWIACNNPKAYGCTYTRDWPEKVTVIVTTYDKKLNNITLHHEIEYHVKRDIKH